MVIDWQAMTLDDARKLPEACKGAAVYFLWRGDELLYIGASTNVGERIPRLWRDNLYGKLHQHRHKQIPFDRATALKADKREIFDIEQALINKFLPPMNEPGYAGHRWAG